MDRMNAPFAPDDAEAERLRPERPPSQRRWKDAKGRHWNLVIPHTVYPPREDTDLLAQWLAKQGPSEGRTAFEIGVGSGAIMLQLAADGWNVSGCDVHPYAVAASRHALKTHGHHGSILEADLGDLDASILAKADLVVWNTPYLPPVDPTKAHLGPLEEASLCDPFPEGAGHALLARLDEAAWTNTQRAVVVVRQQAEAGLRADATARGWRCSIEDRLTFEDGERLSVVVLAPAWPEATTMLVTSTASTNADLLGGEGGVGDTLRAEHQTEGRGRRSSVWSSGEGDLTASWVIHDGASPVPSHGLIQAACALATREALIDVGCPEAEHVLLKWPNDVLVEQNGAAKAGGWLIEARQHGPRTRVVAGVGINLTEGPSAVHGTPRAHVGGTTASTLHTALHARLCSRLGDLASAEGRRRVREEAITAYQASARHLGMMDHDGRDVVPTTMDEHGGLCVEGRSDALHDLDAVEWRFWP